MSFLFDIINYIVTIFCSSSMQDFIERDQQIRARLVSAKQGVLQDLFEFEIENISDKPTSVETTVVVSIYSKSDSLECIYFDIYGNDTELPVGTSRKFVAHIRESQAMTIGNRVACYRFSEINGSSVEIVVE